MHLWSLRGITTAITVSVATLSAQAAPQLERLWSDLMKTAHGSPKLSQKALSDKLLVMLIKGTSPAFHYADPSAEQKLKRIFVDCAIFGGPSRLIFMDAALRLSLIEVVTGSGNHNITYVVRSTPSGVIVDSVSPSNQWHPKPLVIRVLTAKGDEVLNTIITTQGIKSLCAGQYGPIWIGTHQ